MNSKGILAIAGGIAAVGVLAVGISLLGDDFGPVTLADAEDATPAASASADPSASPSLAPSADPSASAVPLATESTPTVEETPTPRGNDLNFVISGENGAVFSFTANGDDYSITTDQAATWGGVSDCIVTVPTNCTSITTAGREGSAEPGEWFAARVGVAQIQIEGPGAPDDWNFAYTANIGVTVDGQQTLYPVVVGQYKNADRNVWTIAGVGINWNNISEQQMGSADGVLTITATDVDTFEIVVAPSDVPPLGESD